MHHGEFMESHWRCSLQREETCIFIQKSTKTLIMNAALGHGSELLIDIAPGVDWTAAVAVVLGIQQVRPCLVSLHASIIQVFRAQDCEMIE